MAVAIVPAAGVGTRLDSSCPKQYLPLSPGKTLLAYTLTALAENDWLQHIFVVISAEDGHWSRHNFPALDRRISALRCGGRTRAHSVYNALQVLIDRGFSAEQWVLVHDAARPFIQADDVQRLYTTLGDEPVGGLLAIAATDTIKQWSPETHTLTTLKRETLWQAQTPQMFRLQMLYAALAERMPDLVGITDEASAMEAQYGAKIRLVSGNPGNRKITNQADWWQAKHSLRVE